MNRPRIAVIDHTGRLISLVHHLERWCDVEFFDRPSEAMLTYSAVIAHPSARDVAALLLVHRADRSIPFVFPTSDFKELTHEGPAITRDEDGAYIIDGSDAEMDARIREILRAHNRL